MILLADKSYCFECPFLYPLNRAKAWVLFSLTVQGRCFLVEQHASVLWVPGQHTLFEEVNSIFCPAVLPLSCEPQWCNGEKRSGRIVLTYLIQVLQSWMGIWWSHHTTSGVRKRCTDLFTPTFVTNIHDPGHLWVMMVALFVCLFHMEMISLFFINPALFALASVSNGLKQKDELYSQKNCAFRVLSRLYRSRLQAVGRIFEYPSFQKCSACKKKSKKKAGISMFSHSLLPDKLTLDKVGNFPSSPAFWNGVMNHMSLLSGLRKQFYTDLHRSVFLCNQRDLFPIVCVWALSAWQKSCWYGKARG